MLVVEEPVSGSEDEDEGVVEDDNETPVIEEETTPEEEAEETPEETPEVTPEETPEVTPEEPAEETPDFGASMISFSDAAVQSDVPVTFKFTVDGETPTETELTVLNEYVTDKTGIDDGKTTADADPAFKISIPETVELEIGSVTAKIDGATEGITITAASDVYTVTNGKDAETSVEITIALVTKTYSVGAPADDSTSRVSWKIKTGKGTYNTTPVTVKKDESVMLEATLAANADNVAITVPGATPETATLTGAATQVTQEFTVVMTADRIAALENSKLTATYEVTKAAADVLIKGTKPGATAEADPVEAKLPTDFSAQYRVKTTGAKDFDEWKAVTGEKIAAKKDDVIQLKFAPGAKFSVSSVTFGTSNAAATVDVVDDEVVYQITVAAPAATPGTENTVTVALEAANQITLKGAADAQIASVKWNTDNGTTWNFARKTADGWVADTKSATVYFQVEAKAHNQVVRIDKGEHKTEDCDNCLISEAGKTVTTSKVDASGADDIELTITTEPIMLDYTLDASEGLTVTIKDDKSTAVPAKGTSDAEKNIYVLKDGDTYFVEVKQGDAVVALENLSSAKANGIADNMDYDADKDAFTFEASENITAANRKIEITLKGKENKNVSLLMAKDDLTVASVKADEHKKMKDDNTAEETVAADTTAVALSTTAKVYPVLEGEKFSFALSVADEAYVVSKVETSTDNGTTWSDLAVGADEKYTLAEVNANTQIRVTTDLNPTTAYSITFTADDNVKAITMELADSANPTTSVTVGEKYYLKAATNATVSFKVETYSGFEVDKVKYGTADDADVTKSGEIYKYTLFTADNKEATINVSTKAKKLASDRYVKFTGKGFEDGSVELNVKTANVKTEKDETDDKDVYVLTQEVKDGDNVTTPEVPELAFDLIVKDGYTIQPQIAAIADGEMVRATADSRTKGEDGRWVYSFKVVAAALVEASAGTKAAPKEITVNSSIEEMVTLSLKSGSASVQYKDLNSYSPRFISLTSGTATVSDKDTIVLKVAEGQSLSVGGEDVTESLDEGGNYSFVAALDPKKDNDTTIEINVTNAAADEYELLYSDVAAMTNSQKVGKDAIEAKLGDKIYVQLNKIDSPSNTPEAITAVALSESAKKSTAVKDAEQVGKAVITVGDADFTVTFKAIKPELVNGFNKKTVVDAATIHITAKDADGTTLTAKGITNNKTIKLDATKTASYPLTLKSGKTTLDVKKYIAGDALVVESSKAAVRAEFNGYGELVLTALNDKDGENKAVSDITIKAKGAAADAKPLLTFKVEVQTPKLPVKSLDSPNQGMHDLLINVTGDSKIGTVATEDFAMYYEIDVKHKDGSSTAKKDGVYYLDALDGNGNVIPVSQLIKVNSDTEDKCENTYTVTTRLVAVAAGTSVTEGVDVTSATKLADSAVKYASEKAVTKDFKTRPGNYEEKLGVTKKTTKMYTGQNDVLVAIPKFSAKAGHIEDIEAQVYNTDGSSTSSVEAYVDPDTMGVYVDVGDYAAPGNGAAKYNVVIYATATTNAVDAEKDPGAYNMYRASAKVPITVQKGINSITVDGNPGKIALVPDNKGNKKDVSFTLKPTGWYNRSYNYKAQTQKFDYYVSDYANEKNRGMVTVKNGKVTVNKNFYVSNDPAQNEFTISVKANDWSGNYTYADDVTVEVTNTAMAINSVRLVKSDGTPYGATIKANELYGAKVEILDGNNKKVNASFVTLTPNKGKIYVTSNGNIRQDGYQKNLTITAVAKDGKKAKKSSIKYTIEYPKVDSYTLENVRVNSSLKQLSDTSWEYVGRGNETVSFNVKAVIDEYNYGGNVTNYSYSVKIAGGKNTSSKYNVENGYYAVTPTADKVTVTVTDKNSKPAKSYTFTFTDKNWKTVAAPKATTKDKLFVVQDPNEYYDNYVAQRMTYTIKNCKYNAVKFTCVSEYGISGLAGVHDITGDTLELTNLVPYYATTAKYSVVYGDKDENGNFWPKTKAATISIKVNKVGTIKAVNKYTISTNLGYSAMLDAKPIPTSTTLGSVVRFDSIEAANVKGQPNKFYEYFELNETKDAIQIKTKYQNEAGLTAIEGLEKTDFTGYLTYTVYTPNGTRVKKQDKITLVVNDTGKPKATATEINIVGKNAASAYTNVKIGSTSVNVLKVITDSADWTVAAATAAEMEAGAAGNVKLTAKAAPAAGNVNLYILPVGSKYTTSTTDDVIKEKGIKVTVKVNVKDETDTKFSKIKFLSKAAKTPEAAIAGTKVNLTTTFTLGTDYEYTLSNAAVTSVEKVPEAKEAEIKNAASKTAAKAIGTVTLNTEKTAVTIVMDRDAEGLDQKGKTTYQVPVLVKFDAGAEEIVYFPIKPAAVPSLNDVKAKVETALKELPVTAYNNGTSAAAEVQTAACALGTDVVSPLSGVDVTKITAAAKADTETEKFADTGTKGEEGFKEGHHTVVVTLDDETKKGTEGYTAATIDVKVTEKAATVALGTSLTNAINEYLLPNTSTGAVPEGRKEVPTTMTKWTLQTELQAAADKAESGKYIVRVESFTMNTDEITVPATPAANTVNADEGTKKNIVSALTFSYSVQLIQTGEYVAADGTASSIKKTFLVTMGTASNTVNAPAAPVTPVTPTSYDVTVEGVTDSTVTYKIVEANEEAPEATDITNEFPATGKVSVESGKKLYLKVVYDEGTVVVKKGSETITGSSDVYEIGEITAAVTVMIEETANTPVEGDQ